MMIKRSKLKFLLLALALLGLAGVVAFEMREETAAPGLSSSEPSSEQDKEAEKIDPASLDIKSPESIHVLVNKQNGLSDLKFRPSDLVTPNVKTDEKDSDDERSVRALIKAELEEMFTDAKAQKLDIMMNSGFRSYKSQLFYFLNYSNTYGEAEALKFSAKPGFSEHQTGLSVDISNENRECYLDECFGGTKAGRWLAENAHKYGFILRYLEGKDEVTGYQYEPWHFRYVGKEVAKEVYEQNLTYEEYLAKLNLITL